MTAKTYHTTDAREMVAIVTALCKLQNILCKQNMLRTVTEREKGKKRSEQNWQKQHSKGSVSRRDVLEEE